MSLAHASAFGFLRGSLMALRYTPAKDCQTVFFSSKSSTTTAAQAPFIFRARRVRSSQDCASHCSTVIPSVCSRKTPPAAIVARIRVLMIGLPFIAFCLSRNSPCTDTHRRPAPMFWPHMRTGASRSNRNFPGTLVPGFVGYRLFPLRSSVFCACRIEI